MMQALILAGGLGTRLRPAIQDLPKGMVRVAGRPFLEHLLLQLSAFFFEEVILCISHLGRHIREYFGDGSRWSIRIRYSEEPEPLGTAGAIKLASKLIKDDDFLVMNGDSFFDIDLDQLIAFHFEKKALGTIALTDVEDTGRFGRVRLGVDGEIAGFSEKGLSGPGMINAGIYVFNKGVFNYIPSGKVSLEQEVVPKLIGKGLYGMLARGFFVDIGTPKSLQALQSCPGPLLAAIEECVRKRQKRC